MEVKNIKENEFEQVVLKSEIPVLVDIWAPWCGPCKMLGPVIEEVAGETDEFQVVKVNADEAQELSQKYRVFSIPTLLVFKGGEEVKRSVGVISKADIKRLME